MEGQNLIEDLINENNRLKSIIEQKDNIINELKDLIVREKEISRREIEMLKKGTTIHIKQEIE
jgi:dynactin complex subunit